MTSEGVHGKSSAFTIGGNIHTFVILGLDPRIHAGTVIVEASGAEYGAILRRCGNASWVGIESAVCQPFFRFHRRFFPAISITCTISAKYFHPHPLPPPA
jgi:hypothetical protein